MHIIYHIARIIKWKARNSDDSGDVVWMKRPSTARSPRLNLCSSTFNALFCLLTKKYSIHTQALHCYSREFQWHIIHQLLRLTKVFSQMKKRRFVCKNFPQFRPLTGSVLLCRSPLCVHARSRSARGIRPLEIPFPATYLRLSGSGDPSMESVLLWWILIPVTSRASGLQRDDKLTRAPSYLQRGGEGGEERSRNKGESRDGRKKMSARCSINSLVFFKPCVVCPSCHFLPSLFLFLDLLSVLLYLLSPLFKVPPPVQALLIPQTSKV